MYTIFMYIILTPYLQISEWNISKVEYIYNIFIQTKIHNYFNKVDIFLRNREIVLLIVKYSKNNSITIKSYKF
jgi:hypothetical protein